MIYSLILFISLSLFCLVLLLNAEYLSYLFLSRRFSLLSNHPVSQSILTAEHFNKLFLRLGKFSCLLLPRRALTELESDYNNLDKNIKELYRYLAVRFLFIIFFGIAYLCSSNLIFLISLLLVFIVMSFETSMQISKNIKSIERDSSHVIACLKVLLVEAETPLNLALNIVNEGLPEYMGAIKKELSRISQKAEKLGMREALLNWRTESNNFKDLLSILLSIYEGASKKAIKASVDSLLSKTQEERLENMKNESDNLQLYLIVPAVLMFLATMFPIIHAMSFMFNLSGLKFGF